jgi:hypothetical protein
MDSTDEMLLRTETWDKCFQHGVAKTYFHLDWYELPETFAHAPN